MMRYIQLAVILLLFILPIYFYGQVPDKVISHWDAEGNPNGHMDKPLGLFLLPVITLMIYALMKYLPGFDPMRKNAKGFEKEYDTFISIMLLFMLMMESFIIVSNMGYDIPVSYPMGIGIAAIFYYTGTLLEKAKMNWFIGIRTPWTLSNENVWNKTHALGGKLFRICGVIALLGIFAPKQYAIWIIIVPILLVSLGIIVYSYLEYKKEIKK
ncbi:MAG: SdpI family protein [Candidatus Micrarchaeota archaeon]